MELFEIIRKYQGKLKEFCFHKAMGTMCSRFTVLCLFTHVTVPIFCMVHHVSIEYIPGFRKRPGAGGSPPEAQEREWCCKEEG